MYLNVASSAGSLEATNPPREQRLPDMELGKPPRLVDEAGNRVRLMDVVYRRPLKSMGAFKGGHVST